MKLSVTSDHDEAYQNFVDSVRDSQTLRKYNGYLKHFLKLIPNKMYKEYLVYEQDLVVYKIFQIHLSNKRW